MTRLVFATWHSGMRAALRSEFYNRVATSRAPVFNVLATRTYAKEVTHCAAYASLLPQQVNLWLDSGAYSVWRSGEVFEVKEYAQYIKALLPSLKVFRKVFVMSLDQIPGVYGQPVSRSAIDAALQISLANVQYLQSQGLAVVPIHHQGEPLWVFEEYLKMADYVGISPANDSPQSERLRYLRSLLPLFKGKKVMPATHNFGNIPPSQLTLFPFFSADSQSWRVKTQSYGQDYELKLCGPGRRKSDVVMSHRAKDDPVAVLAENVQMVQRYERDLQKLWAHRGITWKEPKGLDLT